MASAGGWWTEEHVDQVLGNLLRAGVVIAASVVIVGGAIYLARHGSELADHREFLGEPEELRTPAGIVRAALAGRGRGVIALGLLLLIATPVARVAMAAYAFAREHDWLYFAIATFVLVVLLVSFAYP
jgi:uncharacterized membrane protein